MSILKEEDREAILQKIADAGAEILHASEILESKPMEDEGGNEVLTYEEVKGIKVLAEAFKTLKAEYEKIEKL